MTESGRSLRARRTSCDALHGPGSRPSQRGRGWAGTDIVRAVEDAHGGKKPAQVPVELSPEVEEPINWPLAWPTAWPTLHGRHSMLRVVEFDRTRAWLGHLGPGVVRPLFIGFGQFVGGSVSAHFGLQSTNIVLERTRVAELRGLDQFPGWFPPMLGWVGQIVWPGSACFGPCLPNLCRGRFGQTRAWFDNNLGAAKLGLGSTDFVHVSTGFCFVSAKFGLLSGNVGVGATNL